MSFFKSSQNPQILFLFQFIQLFSPKYAYSRPISNLSYRFLFPKSQLSIFRNLLQTLLLLNLASKFLSTYFLVYSPYSSLLRYQYYSYLVLRVLNLAYLVLRILHYRKLLSLAYSYVFKLSYYSLLPVIIRYWSLSCPYQLIKILNYSLLFLDTFYSILEILGIFYPIIEILIFSYLILRILSLQLFTFIKQ